MPEVFDEGDKLRRIKRSLVNPSKALKQIGALMVAESQRAFVDQRFGNKDWPPRGGTGQYGINLFGIIQDFHEGRKSPKERRFDRRPALVDTGRLRQTIASWIIANDTVEVGSTLPYAGLHNVGSLKSGIKAESLPLTKTVREALGAWLKKQNIGIRSRIGWVLNKRYLNKSLEMDVPERQFVGITDTTRQNVTNVIARLMFETEST